MTEPQDSSLDATIKGFWQNPFAFNVVMFTIAGAISIWMINSAFRDQFECAYLIVDQVSAPEFMCTGADLGEATGVTSVVDDVSDFLGLGDDDESTSVVGDSLTIPGLAGLIDGPLNVIRRIGVVAGLLLLAAFSAWMTWILRHLQHVLRLLQLDREAWHRTALTARTFISVFLVVLVPIWLVAVL